MMTTHPSSMAGLKMPMCCTQAERRRVEQILTAAKLRGTYLPLRPWAKPWWKSLVPPGAHNPREAPC